jgi:hypothetical protein
VLVVVSCVRLSAYLSAASALITRTRTSLIFVVSPAFDDQYCTSMFCSPGEAPKLSLAMPKNAIQSCGLLASLT